MINWTYLNAALMSLKEDAGGPHLTGRYSALYSAVLLDRHADGALLGVRRALGRLGENLWDALTVVWRVDWQRMMVREGHLDDIQWTYFVSESPRVYRRLGYLSAPAAVVAIWSS